VLQELLMQKLASRRREGRRKKGVVDEAKQEDEDEDEEDDGEDEEDDEEDDDEDDDECESEASDSQTEILECEDEDEFREVMRVLGLQPATLLDNGDLRLPNGHVAVHREVAHIWKQRGTRTGQLALPGSAPGAQAKPKRYQLMLGNGACQIAMTHRQQVREGKRIIAVLREQQKYQFRVGMQQNMLQKKKPQKFRTIAGDMSNCR